MFGFAAGCGRLRARRRWRGTLAWLVLGLTGGLGVLVLGAATRITGAARDGKHEPRDTPRWPEALAGPALVIAVDSSCGACRQAIADLAALDELASAGVSASLRLRNADPGPAAVFEALGPGLLPAYALVDAEGALLGVRRGYLPPALLVLWVRSTLMEPHGGRTLPDLTFRPALATIAGTTTMRGGRRPCHIPGSGHGRRRFSSCRSWPPPPRAPPRTSWWRDATSCSPGRSVWRRSRDPWDRNSPCR